MSFTWNHTNKDIISGSGCPGIPGSARADTPASARYKGVRAPFILVCLLACISSCSALFLPGIDKKGASTARVGDPGLTNAEYAQRLKHDGWPVEVLNTAAEADFLDDNKKNLVLAHNLVRFDPGKFAQLYVAEYLQYFRDREFHYPGMRTILITREGDEPARELYYELMRTRSMGLLQPSEALSEASRSYVRFLCENNARGHGGQGGLIARLKRYGTWQTRVAENIVYGSFSPHDALLFLLIDDHVYDRSHRKIILDSDLRLIGAGKDVHPSFPTGFTYVVNYAYYFRGHESKGDPDK